MELQQQQQQKEQQQQHKNNITRAINVELLERGVSRGWERVTTRWQPLVRHFVLMSRRRRRCFNATKKRIYTN